MENQQFENLQYVVTHPSGSIEKRHPTIIFLHGAGSRGNDIALLRENPFFAENSQVNCGDFPFSVFAPLCYSNTWFDIFEQLQRFVKMVSDHPEVDSERVYLLGTSMGGYGAWQLAMTMPDVFAAVVPICGGGMKWNAARLKDIPVWAFHGKDDQSVPPIQSIQMVDAVNAAGGNATLTLLDNTAHNCWSYAYGLRELFDWMLNYKKTTPCCVSDDSYKGSRQFG